MLPSFSDKQSTYWEEVTTDQVRNSSNILTGGGGGGGEEAYTWVRYMNAKYLRSSWAEISLSLSISWKIRG